MWGSDSGPLSEYGEVGNRGKLVFLGASGMGVAETVAVKALGQAVTLCRFLDFQLLCEEEEGGEEDGHVVGVNAEDHRRALLGEPRSSVLLNVPGRANRARLGVLDEVFDEGKELFVVVREDVGWDPVNCPLYRQWRLGKLKPGVTTDREGLVEAAGEGIEISGLGLCRGVGVGACERDGASVVDFGDEAFLEQAVGVSERGGS